MDELLALAAQTNHTEPGYVSFLANITRNESTSYIPGHYKYIVVVGIVPSTSGRLARLLAHSGAVILLPKSAFVYHFSARLVPWVHYVPLAYSSADLIEKVQQLAPSHPLSSSLIHSRPLIHTMFLCLAYCSPAHLNHPWSSAIRLNGCKRTTPSHANWPKTHEISVARVLSLLLDFKVNTILTTDFLSFRYFY